MAGRRSYSEQEKEQFAAQRREKVAELHQQLADNVTRLDDSKEWQRWLSMAAKFHRYRIFNNVLLIASQMPNATLVAGYRAWQAMGHQVRRGESAIKVLGPVTRRVEVTDASGQPVRDVSGHIQYRRQMVGTKPVSVFDASQVDPPVEGPPRPQLLTGQAPEGLWEALAGLVEAEGYRLSRGECGGANGFTDYRGREVRVRSDVDDAQAVKTLAHDLLTAPTGLFCLVGRSLCLGDTPPGFLLSLSFLVVCWAHRHGSTGRALWRRVWVRRDGT